MDSKGKSNAEVIYELLNKMKSGEKITFADIDECISTRSVLDSIAGENAVTIFYSGESEDFINNLSNNGGQNIRMIRRTEAFEFVANNDFQLIVEYAIRSEHPDWQNEAVEKELGRHFYEASSYDLVTGEKITGEGYWTEISRRFAADTKGDAYSLCSNANETRIYAMDELAEWLDNAEDTAKMGGYTKAELEKMSEVERFAAVKEWTIQDMKSSKIYFNDDGIKIGQDFGGTSLEGVVDKVTQSKCAFETTVIEYINYSSDDLMSTKYTDYNSYTQLEKIKAKQYDYERTQITQMLDDGVTSKDGISLLTSDEIKSKYGFIDDATLDSVVRELQIAEYRDRKNGTATAKELEIYFDEDGKVFAAGNSKYKTTEVPDIDVESKFSTTAGDYAQFAPDEKMMMMNDGFAELDELAKIKSKQANLEFERLLKEINLENVSERSITKYLDAFNDANKSMNPKAVTKTLNNLNVVEKLMIKLGDAASDTKFSEAVDNFTSKIKGISKTGKVVLPAVDDVCNALQAVDTLIAVIGYKEQGDYYNDTKEEKLYFYLRLVTLIQSFQILGLSLVILKNKGC